MSASTRFSIVALFCLKVINVATANEDIRLLEAIAQVESGFDRKAIGKAGERGMYQVMPTTWKDAEERLKREGYYRYPLSKWRDATAQDMIAAAHLRTLRERFALAGILTPSAEQLALAWNVGFRGAHDRAYRPNDYAVRVANLFRLHAGKPL